MTQSDTRERILDASQNLIQRLGANGMSYQHVSEEVGIRKASIHHHFATKTDLLQDVCSRYSESFFALVDAQLDRESSAVDRLQRYCKLFEGPLCESDDLACLCAMLGAEIESLDSAPAAEVRAFIDGNVSRLTKLLDEGRRHGEFDFVGSPRSVAQMCFSLLEGATLIARADGGIKRLREITRQMLRLLEA
ncbi:MAG: TetR/AcrR family transcriptional regulator [Planctomycetota bacterium]